MGEDDIIPEKEIFPISVNYDLSVESLVILGKYDQKSDDVTDKNFPTSRKGIVELEIILVPLKKVVFPEEADKELDKIGLRSANLRELLTFGVKYPDIQRRYPAVVAPRQPVRYCRNGVAILTGDDRERGLFLIGSEVELHEDCRFAAVSK